MGVNWEPWPTQCLHAALESESTWGYVIYRTTCSPLPSTLFSRTISQISSGIKNHFFSEYDSAQKDKLGRAHSTLYLGTLAEHSRVIIVDPTQFDPTSIDSSHSHFESWRASQEKPDHCPIYWRCLIYDENSQHAYLSAPLQDGEGGTEWNKNEIHKFHDVKPTTALQGADNEEYDAFMGGERSDRKGIEPIPGKDHIMAMSGSEDDEYDGFLGGYI